MTTSARLLETLKASPSGCPDGCETTRARFPAAIEREVAGEGPDEELYARLEQCPACAREYLTLLDMAARLDRDPLRAADAPPLSLPFGVRRTQRDAEDQRSRRVAEDAAPYEDESPTTDP